MEWIDYPSEGNLPLSDEVYMGRSEWCIIRAKNKKDGHAQFFAAYYDRSDGGIFGEVNRWRVSLNEPIYPPSGWALWTDYLDTDNWEVTHWAWLEKPELPNNNKD